MKKAAFVLVALVAAGVASAPSADASKSAPIRMSGKIVDSPTPDPTCGGLRNASTGTLAGHPFGKSTWTSTGCLDITAEPGVITSRDATFVLKNAQGSISGAYSGHVSLPSAGGHLYGESTFTITKGTGAYRGARGSGLITSTGDFVAASADLDMAGTLIR